MVELEKEQKTEQKVEQKETPTIYKNYGAPVLFIIIVPIILFYVLKKSTTVSQNIFPNKISVIVLVLFLLWGYGSLRLFPQNFDGPKNVDGSVPKYQGNGGRVCAMISTPLASISERLRAMVS